MCDRNRGQRVRLLASAGIVVQATHKGVVGKPEEDEQLSLANQRFTMAPDNPEVLTLVGNLHLSLCDWAPAQNVFDQLLVKRISTVEAYSKLSMGNIYFANLNVPKTYRKHLKKASELYMSILQKDTANAYAANGIGTVFAEKGEIFKAKEVFNRVREVSGDTIADAHLNLGHIYLAQKKHAEALQMYQSYMTKTQDGTAPITTKNRADDEADVLVYIAYAYFDWARQTEAMNDARAAPADGRYQKCIARLEMANSKSLSERKAYTVRYNLCMAKLQAANCVLQKLTRNIRRTVDEVQNALKGLEESLPMVKKILEDKLAGRKVMIPTSMLQDFITQCNVNIESAKSHRDEEVRRAEEAKEFRLLREENAAAKRKQEEVQRLMREAEEKKKQEDQDHKAEIKMLKVKQLQESWEAEKAAADAVAKGKKKGGQKGGPPPGGNVQDATELVEVDADATKGLFDDDDSDSDDDGGGTAAAAAAATGRGAGRGGDIGDARGSTKPVDASKLFESDDSDDDDDAALGSGIGGNKKGD